MSLSVKIIKLPELDELEFIWRDLESRSNGGFFVSWAWIGVWLANLPHGWPLRLMRADMFGKSVGLGILAGGEPKKICNVPYCVTEHLHETGVRSIDMVIEHNDFLLDASCEKEVRAAMIDHWLGGVRKVSELGVPGTSRAAWMPDGFDHQRHGMRRYDMTMNSHAMDLNDVRRMEGDPLALMDGRTRAKIRRAMREYAQLGPLRVQVAETVVEGLEWLDSLEMLHQKRWESKGESGCFSNPVFVRFHRMMIARNHQNGSAIVMRITVGNAALGYLYGFSDKQRFYVYQCGFDYGLVERSSMPGLVCHVLAMKFMAEAGLRYYDFMAGFSGYKSMLSNVVESMTWTIFRSESLRFRLIEHVRPAIARIERCKNRLVSKWRGIRSISPQPSIVPINQGV